MLHNMINNKPRIISFLTYYDPKKLLESDPLSPGVYYQILASLYEARCKNEFDQVYAVARDVQDKYFALKNPGSRIVNTPLDKLKAQRDALEHMPSNLAGSFHLDLAHTIEIRSLVRDLLKKISDIREEKLKEQDPSRQKAEQQNSYPVTAAIGLPEAQAVSTQETEDTHKEFIHPKESNSYEHREVPEGKVLVDELLVNRLVDLWENPEFRFTIDKVCSIYEYDTLNISLAKALNLLLEQNIKDIQLSDKSDKKLDTKEADTENPGESGQDVLPGDKPEQEQQNMSKFTLDDITKEVAIKDPVITEESAPHSRDAGTQTDSRYILPEIYLPRKQNINKPQAPTSEEKTRMEDLNEKLDLITLESEKLNGEALVSTLEDSQVKDTKEPRTLKKFKIPEEIYPRVKTPFENKYESILGEEMLQEIKIFEEAYRKAKELFTYAPLGTRKAAKESAKQAMKQEVKKFFAKSLDLFADTPDKLLSLEDYFTAKVVFGQARFAGPLELLIKKNHPEPDYQNTYRQDLDHIENGQIWFKYNASDFIKDLLGESE